MEKMKKDASISEDLKYRYMLSRIWNKDKKIIMFVWLNPSIADDKINDPTITRCINFTKDWWYWGFYMTNLFAYRATEPKNMKNSESPIWIENDFYIEKYYNKVDLVVCMWWNNWNFKNRSKEFTNKFKWKLHYLELNKSWEPKHLLYSKSELRPKLYL